MKTIYVITGQTATGKTKYALELAKKYNGELINCDSRQIYKKLDVITGKDLSLTDGNLQIDETIDSYDIGYYKTKDEVTKIWLYDVVNPDIPFSAVDYKICAVRVIDDMFRRGKTPIVVGGTYFYLQHLLYGTVENTVEPNEELRRELEEISTEKLQKLLQNENAELFDSLNRSEQFNRQRLMRRIEKERSGVQKDQDVASLDDHFSDVSIEMTGFRFSDKDKLRKKIEQRVEERLEAGAVDEVKGLLADGYTADNPGLRTIGYTQIIQYLLDDLTFDAMKQEWITKELQYAKRQLIFIKRDTNIHWIDK